MVGELAHAISIEVFVLEAAAGEFETIEVRGIILFESTNQSLHVELGVDLVLAEVGEADFDFVAELGGLFFGFGDTGFIAFGEFNLGGVAATTAGGWAEESTKSFD